MIPRSLIVTDHEVNVKRGVCKAELRGKIVALKVLVLYRNADNEVVSPSCLCSTVNVIIDVYSNRHSVGRH